jgi:glutamate/tyrosine decarboxylase-like PLP-dependent enzyme
MPPPDLDAVLETATVAARRYLGSLPDRQVYRPVAPDEVRALVDRPLPDDGLPPEEVVADLARDLEPYVAAHASGRYFGFVVGGLHPAAYGAELLVSTWDQNAAMFAPTPGVAAVEEVAARWLVELLGLPAGSSVGFVTGGQMANFTCLAAARDHVLGEVGWDVRADGLAGAPHLNVVLKTGKHATVTQALRYLGLGERTAVEVACDDEDRFLLDELRTTLAGLEGPTIVCAEAGNVNTGSFDRFGTIADLVDDHRARGNPTWVHVDGAVGLLAAASDERRHLTDAVERMDSWSTDGHKLLNVTYDCGIAMCRNAAAHQASMGARASYLIQSEGQARDPLDWVPEFSRRARGVAVYATLRSLGRAGLAALVDRTSRLAQRFAAELTSSGHATIVNDVVLNQVLVRWHAPEHLDPDEVNEAVVAAIQADGTAYVSPTTWRGRRMMRISVADWSTDEHDVDRTVAAMLRCHDQVAAADPA